MQTCSICGFEGYIEGHKDYNVTSNGQVTETLVWVCPNQHMWESQNESSVDAGMTPFAVD